MAAEVKIVGNWEKISIVSVEFGFSQILKNGKWINTSSTPKRFETEILTFGKYFNNEKECIQFMNTKLFKSVFAAIKKNC